MRVAFDTNILAYAQGLNGAERQAAAVAALDAYAGDDRHVPAQVLGELYTVLTRKGRMAPAAARAAVLEWSNVCSVVQTDLSHLVDAMELAVSHGLAFWDAVIMAVAASAGCRLLLSEDMQDGFTWRGVTIRNPMRTPP